MRRIVTDENYIVLARKYRPKKFSDIIGQNEVCSVIEGAIKLKRVAHAFLFSGTRGVGKTTIARILAKTLNCESLDGNTLNPCEKCSNCISIQKESNIDVIEIDAASRTGVADVREIIENINYKPVNAKKKVFIIDEVHMLSKAAFNALLKTLEEPPLDVVFIFATTETEKVPITILSRCQKFVLRRVDFNKISEHLVNISEKEGFTLDLESANLISVCSEGSLRDALSILENVLAKNKPIDIDLVRQTIGLSDHSQCLDLFEFIFKGKVVEAMNKFQSLYENGISTDELAKLLMTYSYNLATLKSGVKNSNDFLDSKTNERLKKISEIYEMDFITRFWELMQKYLNELSDTFDEKQCFEMTIIRICYVSLIPTPFEVLKKTSTVKTEVSIDEKKKNDFKDNENTDRAQTNHHRSSNDNLALKKKIVEPNLSSNDHTNDLEKFSNIVQLIEDNSEMLIAYHLRHSFRLVSFTEFIGDKPVSNVELESVSANEESKNILWKASKLLTNLTKKRWVLSITNKKGLQSLTEFSESKYKDRINEIKKEQTIKKILDIIPHSEVVSIEKIVKENKETKDG
ncbi:MAG: DNA polymerase III, subunit gamma and tau [alpha proteobacterium MED-G10]|nr:MAG: DNA polymerase III, subunit gamma and tau [alpha proteobacterium MED-G10]